MSKENHDLRDYKSTYFNIFKALTEKIEEERGQMLNEIPLVQNHKNPNVIEIKCPKCDYVGKDGQHLEKHMRDIHIPWNSPKGSQCVGRFK